MNRRVVVTGIGIASPLGIGRETFWSALTSGASGVRKISAFDASGFACQDAGQVPDYRIADYVPKTYRKATKLMARDIELAVIAATLAIDDAGLASRATTSAPPWDPTRFGCNIGAGLISVDLDELTAAMTAAERDGELALRIWGTAMQGLTPLWLLKYLPNMLACHVTIIHGLEGPSNTLACGEASGHLAIGEAFRVIQRGQADLMICGGAETKVNPIGMLRQSLLGRLAKSLPGRPGSGVSPFGDQSLGTVNGEGGGLLVLEEMEHAVRRGARMYAEVVGFGAGQDTHGLAGCSFSTNGYRGAIESSLRDARVEPSDISLLVPSGSGVKQEDEAETAVLERVFGRSLAELPAALTKPQMGSLAAGTSVDVAAAILSLYHQTIPPSLNASDVAGRFNVSPVARPADLDTLLTSSWSTGGQSGSIVINAIH